MMVACCLLGGVLLLQFVAVDWKVMDLVVLGELQKQTTETNSKILVALLSTTPPNNSTTTRTTTTTKLHSSKKTALLLETTTEHDNYNQEPLRKESKNDKSHSEISAAAIAADSERQQRHNNKKSKTPVANTKLSVSDDGAATVSSSSSSSACFRLNSPEWVQGPRFGNSRLEEEGMMTSAAVVAQEMILDIADMLVNKSVRTTITTSPPQQFLPLFFQHSQARSILGLSMSLPQSRFLNDPAMDANNPRHVRLWAVRLIYWALHYHQHAPAMPEARLRFGNGGGWEGKNHNNYNTTTTTTVRDTASGAAVSCTPNELKAHEVGNFDYECPDAKYLLITMAGMGIGANIRGGAVQALLSGLATDRVVLFVNQAPAGRPLTIAWELSSCPRRDFQCFFMPTTPCTLTHADLENAYYLNKHESRQLWNHNRLPPEHADDKVVHGILLYFPPVKLDQSVLGKIAQYARRLIPSVEQLTTADDAETSDAAAKNQTATDLERLLPVLNEAVKSIRVQDPPRAGYNFAAASLKVNHALVFYSMRPNPTSARQLADIRQEIIPADLNPEATIGLPIRASDKCHRESECLSFDEHMLITSDAWDKHLGYLKNASSILNNNSTRIADDPTVIFTSEAKDVLAEQKAFALNDTRQANYPHRFRFVTNTKDVLPGTGKLKRSQHRSNGDAVMLSSMSTLQAQMMAGTSIGNCCSNYHLLMSDFLMEGLGAASDNRFLCLQEHENPMMRVCCGWHHDCKEMKKKLKAANNLTLA